MKPSLKAEKPPFKREKRGTPIHKAGKTAPNRLGG
jgi:hypothetical protein